MSITLYHYTNRDSASNIKSDKVIYRSENTIADARWGIGVYFTVMDPNNFTAEEIAYNNWLRTLSARIRRKLEFCIVVTFPISEIQDCCEDDRRIFLYPGRDVNLNSYQHRVIQTNL